MQCVVCVVNYVCCRLAVGCAASLWVENVSLGFCERCVFASALLFGVNASLGFCEICLCKCLALG